MRRSPDFSRRDFLQGSLGAALLFLSGCSTEEPLALEADGNLLGSSAVDPFSGGDFLESLPFIDEGTFQSGERSGQGLDGRLTLNLSKLNSLTTSNDDFFVRTFPPDQLATDARWKIKLHGLVNQPVEVGIDELTKAAKPMGTVLMECAGNGPPLHFGLLSCCQWSGVPFSTVLKKAETRPEATHILVSGFDGRRAPSKYSTPGASWIFTPEQLAQAGAFLATRMNGQPLPVDHGFPIRLIVPGWYGCTCIKWLDEIKLVNAQEPATAQMEEFAERTHQQGIPKLAGDYQPATIDRMATPIRVERWRLDGKIAYRIVGLTWGEPVSSGQLSISCKQGEKHQPVTACPPLTSKTEWAIWSHRWEPTSPGEHHIRLKLANSTANTRRLGLARYVRKVNIPQEG